CHLSDTVWVVPQTRRSTWNVRRSRGRSCPLFIMKPRYFSRLVLGALGWFSPLRSLSMARGLKGRGPWESWLVEEMVFLIPEELELEEEERDDAEAARTTGD